MIGGSDMFIQYGVNRLVLDMISIVSIFLLYEYLFFKITGHPDQKDVFHLFSMCMFWYFLSAIAVCKIARLLSLCN